MANMICMLGCGLESMVPYFPIAGLAVSLVPAYAIGLAAFFTELLPALYHVLDRELAG